MIDRPSTLGIAAAAIALFGMCAPAQGAGLGKKIKTFGNWTVYRSVDAMTDDLVCTAALNGKAYIQVSIDAMYLSYYGKGGVQGYQIRFDSAPALPLELSGGDQNNVEISGEEFQMALAAKRLRLSGLSVLKQLINEDLNITGIKPAHDFILGDQCMSTAQRQNLRDEQAKKAEYIEALKRLPGEAGISPEQGK